MLIESKIKTIVAAVNAADEVEVMMHGYSESVPADPVTGDPGGQVLMLSYSEDELDPANYLIFTEQGLSDAVVEDNRITARDIEGDEYNIRLWKRSPLNVVDFL